MLTRDKNKSFFHSIAVNMVLHFVTLCL